MLNAHTDLANHTRRINKMKKVLFARPLVALMFAVACKKQEAAPTEQQPVTEQVAAPATEAAPAAVVATPAPAPVTPAKPAVKKGK